MNRYRVTYFQHGQVHAQIVAFATVADAAYGCGINMEYIIKIELVMNVLADEETSC